MSESTTSFTASGNGTEHTTPATTTSNATSTSSSQRTPSELALQRLRQLLPGLSQQSVELDQWWHQVILGVLREENGFEAVREVSEAILSLISPSPLTPEEERLPMASRDTLVISLLDVYCNECAPTAASLVNDTNGLKENIEDLMVAYGGSNAQDFFMAAFQYFSKAKYRPAMLDLLVTHARRQDLHLHHIVNTPLMEALLCSLLLDKSALVVTSGISLLLMLMPRICTSLAPMLPMLFWICMRALYWKPPSTSDLDEITSGENLGLGLKSDMANQWELAVDADTDVRVPEAAPLFNILYGMFPCNMLKFLQSPTNYTMEVECCYGRVIIKEDDELIRTESMNLLRQHALHPNLIKFTTAEEERNDTSRWMNVEPADIVAECVSMKVDLNKNEDQDDTSLLDVSLDHLDKTLVMTSDITEDETIRILDVEAEEGEDILGRHVPYAPTTVEISQSINTTSEEPKCQPIKSRKSLSSDEVSLRSILAAHRALTSGKLIGAEHWDMSELESPFIHTEQGKDATTEQLTNSINILQRKVLLLTNRLNYELFLKQQYTRHIGRLHRDRLMDNVIEADRQGLYNTCRALKEEIRQTKEAYERQRAEAADMKAKHVRWENELNGKLRAFREARKQMNIDIMELQDALDRAMTTISNQETLLKTRYERIVELEHELKGQEALIAKAAEYEQQLAQLSQEMLLWREDTAKFEELRKEAEQLRDLWRTAVMRAEAAEQELEQLREQSSGMASYITELERENERLTKDLERSQKSCQYQVRLWQDSNQDLKRQLKQLDDKYRIARHTNAEQERRILSLLAQLEKAQRILNGKSPRPPNSGSESRKKADNTASTANTASAGATEGGRTNLHK